MYGDYCNNISFLLHLNLTIFRLCTIKDVRVLSEPIYPRRGQQCSEDWYQVFILLKVCRLSVGIFFGKRTYHFFFCKQHRLVSTERHPYCNHTGRPHCFLCGQYSTVIPHLWPHYVTQRILQTHYSFSRVSMLINIEVSQTSFGQYILFW